jgi:cytochrome c oxidase subunit IV
LALCGYSLDISVPAVLSGYIENMDKQKMAGYTTYIYVWLVLCALLALSIAVVKLELLSGLSAAGSLFIASVKAGLVLWFFMHLRNEGWLIKTTLALAVGTLTIIIMLTFSDIWYR